MRASIVQPSFNEYDSAGNVPVYTFDAAWLDSIHAYKEHTQRTCDNAPEDIVRVACLEDLTGTATTARLAVVVLTVDREADKSDFKFIDTKEGETVYTGPEDELLVDAITAEDVPALSSNELDLYRKKVEVFIRDNRTHTYIAKLTINRSLKPGRSGRGAGWLIRSWECGACSVHWASTALRLRLPPPGPLVKRKRPSEFHVSQQAMAYSSMSAEPRGVHETRN